MGEKMTAPDRDPFAFEIASAIIAPQHNNIVRYQIKNTPNAIMLLPFYAPSSLKTLGYRTRTL